MVIEAVGIGKVGRNEAVGILGSPRRQTFRDLVESVQRAAHTWRLTRRKLRSFQAQPIQGWCEQMGNGFPYGIHGLPLREAMR